MCNMCNVCDILEESSTTIQVCVGTKCGKCIDTSNDLSIFIFYLSLLIGDKHNYIASIEIVAMFLTTIT